MCKSHSSPSSFRLTREQELANGCPLIILADSPLVAGGRQDLRDDFAHASSEAFGTDEDRYDLLAVPDLAAALHDPGALQLLRGDVQTAIGLHGNERLLIASEQGGLLWGEGMLGDFQKDVGNVSVIETRRSNRGLGGEPIVLTCMDWRLHGRPHLAEALLNSPLRLASYRLMTTPGVSKELGADSPRQRFIFGQLGRYWGSGPGRVVLLSHLDCGKYGGSRAFTSVKEEADAYVRDMNAAAEALHRSFPAVQVDMAVAMLDDNAVRRVVAAT
jgi:hypothetical protein